MFYIAHRKDTHLEYLCDVPCHVFWNTFNRRLDLVINSDYWPVGTFSVFQVKVSSVEPCVPPRYGIIYINGTYLLLLFLRRFPFLFGTEIALNGENASHLRLFSNLTYKHVKLTIHTRIV